MMELEAARQRVSETLEQFRLDTETVPVETSQGRVLAEPLVSGLDIPPFDKSAMDGYAVVRDDLRDTYIVRGVIRAGDDPNIRPERGECVKIMTGAPVPEGCDRVIQVEHVHAQGGIITVTRTTGARHVCARGEDVARGTVLAGSGTRMTPAMVVTAVSCGIGSVAVYRKIRTAVFSTGDEILPAGTPWRSGKIYDTNGPMLIHLLRTFSADPVITGHIPDDPDAASERITHAAEAADVICFSGGVSAGDFDYMPEALQRCGFKIHFSKLRVKPGRPMTYATSRRCIALGFPGNPVSAFLMFHLFGTQVLFGLNRENQVPRRIDLPMDRTFHRKNAQRLEYYPAVITPRGSVSPVDYHGSGHLAALRFPDGFLVIPPGVHEIAAGSPAPFWPLMVRAYHGDR